MEKKQEIKLNKRAFDPMFCRDGDDFIKLVFVTLTAFAGDEEGDIDSMSIGTRVILHEYLALVLNGELEPFVFDDEFIKQETPGFRQAMHLANVVLASAGIKMNETDDGKMEIDYGVLMKEFGYSMDHCSVKKQKK